MTNSGISFGLNIPGLNLIVGVVLIIILYVSVKDREWRWWPIIVGGGLNLWERVRFGYVTDNWKIPLIPVYNNINDWLIFGGVMLLIWKYYSKMKK